MNTNPSETNRRILVIDDNESIHADFRKILAPSGVAGDDLKNAAASLLGGTTQSTQKTVFDLRGAFQGREGLAAVQEAIQSGRPFEMAFVDVRMPPGWDGIETTARLWEADPDLQIVICTAYSDYPWDEMLKRLGNSDRLLILKKPFDAVEVLQLAGALTEKYRLQQQVRKQLAELEQTVLTRTEELKKSEELFRLITENAVDLIGVVNADGRWLYTSPSFEKLLGYSLGKSANALAFDLVHPEDQGLLHTAVSGTLKNEARTILAYRVRHEDGSWRHLESYIAPFHSPSRAIEGVLIVARDITERKHAEDQLQQKTALFEALVNSSPDAILVVSAQGKRIVQNEQFNRLLKIPPHILEHNDDPEQLRYVTESTQNPEQFHQRITHLLSHPEESSQDEIEFKDGRVLDRNSAPVFGKNHEYYGRVWTFHDITNRTRTEKQLRIQSSALETTANGIMITDRAGQILWVNRAFTFLTGYSYEEAVGKKTAFLKSGKHNRSFYKEMWETILSGSVWHGELVNRRKDGSLYHEEMTITPVRGRNGEIQDFVSVKQDISQRKQFEAQLAHERDLLQALMDNLPDFIYFKDVHSRFTRVNLAHAQHLGLHTPEEAIGKSDADFFPTAAARQKLEDEQRVLATGIPLIGFVEESETAQGLMWVSTTKVPIHNAEGRICGLVGISHNITERKRAENELLAQRASFRALTDNVPDAICRIDADLRYVYVNRVREEMFGIPAADYIGRKITELELPARDARVDATRQVFATGKTAAFEFSGQSTTGPRHWEMRVVPEYAKSGDVEYVLSITRDVTDRKKAESERQLLEVQLRQAQKLESIGQLAAGIAHEINTPTQYVGDNTRFLKDAFGNIIVLLRSHSELIAAAKQKQLTPEFLERIEKALNESDLDYLMQQIPQAILETLEGVDRVTKIVRAMKDFSHPGSKEKAAADLNKAIESTTTVARNEWKYVADLKLELAPDLPLVPCFLGEFNQAILNLVINASHAIGDVIRQNPGAKGLITLRTRHDGDHVEIRVSDTGSGIAEAHRAHIFEPFFTTKEVGKGTGQGLTVVYSSIVKKHGGTVTFETEVGKGTTFILRLPLHPQNPAPPEPPKELLPKVNDKTLNKATA